VKTWVLMAIDPADRLYQGHAGYQDDVRTVYRYDSFVPNHRQLARGDVVIIRNKRDVLGCAAIDRIESASSTKHRNRCPSCRSTRLKERSVQAPRFRCECGSEFDNPLTQEEACVVYAAYFGDTYQDVSDELTISQLWELAPRLNKQLAILEIDTRAAAQLLLRATERLGNVDHPPAAARALYHEGERIAVLANRFERDPRARRACIAHYGCRCVACGFSFAEAYGDLGVDVIEVHHLEP